MLYYCSKCGLAVIEGLKVCNHTEPIIAELSSTARGTSGLQQS